ncbi:MAG: acyl-CoA dehydrogenase family protein [Sphingomonas sp.]
MHDDGNGAAIEEFRAEIAAWLERQLDGPFAALRGNHDVLADVARRRAWEHTLGEARWSAIGWPRAQGGRGASIAERVVFAEEYARAGAPRRIGHIGVELLGPALLALGTEDQKRRFLPDIALGRSIWCQGYSEPGAGSDLAAVRCRARPEGDGYRIEGQKIWTSLAPIADWCFVLVRTTPESVGQKGLSLLLVPLHQPGVEIRPIREMNGQAHFAELFFDGATALAADRIGAEGEGWKVAMAILGFERGVSALGQQMEFRNELDAVIRAARANGMARDPILRQRLAGAHAGLRIMRYSALRMLANPESGALTPEAYTYKLFWSHWHRDLGELAMDVLGQEGEVIDMTDSHQSPLTDMYLMARADTILAGTSQIQRNIISERALGLPREARPPQP